MFPDHPANHLIHHNIMCDNKHHPAAPQHLYVRQPYALQIIQLVECTTPPPPAKYSPSMVPSSSYMSDSDQSSSYESSDATPCGGDDDDEPCSSYCSSLDAEPCLPDLSYPHDPTIDDTYRVRMRRIRAWRDATLATDATSDAASPASRKRKAPISHCTAIEVDAPHAARPHKVARSPSTSPTRSRPPSPARSLSAHSCPACDASFPSPQSLRQHGRASASVNDACRVAVEYGFE